MYLCLATHTDAEDRKSFSSDQIAGIFKGVRFRSEDMRLPCLHSIRMFNLPKTWLEAANPLAFCWNFDDFAQFSLELLCSRILNEILCFFYIACAQLSATKQGSCGRLQGRCFAFCCYILIATVTLAIANTTNYSCASKCRKLMHFWTSLSI